MTAPLNVRHWIDSERGALLLFIVAAIVLLAGVGLRDPWPADEPRFAQVAREMVQSGRWLFPTRGGELYADKPPLFMWTIASLYLLTGSLRVAFLLPSALCSLLTLFLTHALACRWHGIATANRAGILLLLSLQFVLQAKSAQIDAMVSMWIMLGCYGLLRQLMPGIPTGGQISGEASRVGIIARPPKRSNLAWWLLGWFAMGMGMITKGVGFLPILLLLPWLCLRLLPPGVAPVRSARPVFFLGPLAFVAAVLLWLLPMWLAVDSANDPQTLAYRDDILFRQTGDRYTNSWAHIAPWYYYVVSVIPLFWLPATLLLPWLVKPWIVAFRVRDARIVLPLVWVIIVVIFFSASPGKRGGYLLPALPMFVLAVAPYLDRVAFEVRASRALQAILGLLALLFLTLGIAGLLGIEAAHKVETEQGITAWWFVLTLGLLATAGMLLCRPGRAPLAWTVFLLPTWLLYSTWGYTLANDGRTPANIFRAIESQLGAEAKVTLGLVGFREQYLLFSPFPLEHFGFATELEEQMAEAWRWVDEAPDRYLLLADQFPLSCFDRGRSLPLERAHSKDWRLYGANTRRPSCSAPTVTVPRFYYDQPGAILIVR